MSVEGGHTLTSGGGEGRVQTAQPSVDEWPVPPFGMEEKQKLKVGKGGFSVCSGHFCATQILYNNTIGINYSICNFKKKIITAIAHDFYYNVHNAALNPKQPVLTLLLELKHHPTLPQ